MKYNFNGKDINIPDEEIQANMKLGISKEKAIEIWLEDEGYEINEEQEQLMKKSKGMRMDIGAKSDKPRKPRTVAPKEDCAKESIIEALFQTISALEGVTAASIENKTKIVTFEMNGEKYKIDLIRKRASKK